MALQQDQSTEPEVANDRGGIPWQLRDYLIRRVNTTSSSAETEDSSTASAVETPDPGAQHDAPAKLPPLHTREDRRAKDYRRSVSSYSMARDLSGATGMPVKKCQELVVTFVEAMITVAQKSFNDGRPLIIEGIGRWDHHGRNGMVTFRPHDAFIEGVNQPPKPDTVLKRPRFYPRVERTYRDVDVRLIEEWVAVRRGQIAQELAPDALFDTTLTLKNTAWSETTGIIARKVLLNFSFYSPTPLIDVGLSMSRVPIRGDTTEAIAWRRALHAEIEQFAKGFEERTRPRLRELYRVDEQSKDPRDPISSMKLPSVWRTQTWYRFTSYVTDFYNWCIERGYRYPGTNPLEGIKRFGVDSPSKKKRIIVREWYRTCLAYPKLSPTEKVVLYLLGNGLRSIEVRRLRIEHLRLSEGQIDVYGKGGKFRVVRLLPWCLAAVDAYLVSRRFKTSPWLFGKEQTYQWIRTVVKRTAGRVFPMPHQKNQRQHIRPHGYRHYHISTGIELGMDRMAMKEHAGHATVRQTEHYVTVDTTWIDREFAKVADKKWF